MDSMARTHKLGKQAKVILAGSFFLSAVMIINFSRPSPAEQITEHPYIAPDDIKSENCLTCHPDKKEGKAVHTAVGMGCENCHQATSEKDKEKTSITLIAEGGGLCAMCHKASRGPVQHGPYKAGQCLVCHEPHASNFPKQTRAETNTLCMSCHGSNRPDVKVNADAKTVSLLGGRTFDLASYEKAPKIGAEHSDKSAAPTVSHPVTGKDPRKPDAELSCISCHDPHGSQAGKLLRNPTESRNQAENLCLSCHRDIASQIQKKVQHAAVDMGCGTCHSPHKGEPADSPQGTFHLTSAQPDLCLACHDAKDSAIQKAHLGQPFATSRCSECHNPHGSDRPKLVNNFAHQPFADKQCDACHSAPQGGKVEVNEGGRRALCYMCHEDIKTQIEGAKVAHGLFQKQDSCTACHSPHAAAYPHQLRRATVALCETCHVERRTERMTKKFLHPPVFEVGCTVCHDAHASNNPRRLRASINELCLACHGQASPSPAQDGVITIFGNVRVPASFFRGIRRIGVAGDTLRGHPLAGHPISGPNSLTKEGSVITCVTCHNPHASDFTKRRFQLKAGAKSICLNCHA